MATMMELFSPPTNDYERPSSAAIEELKLFGISDFGVKLGVAIASTTSDKAGAILFEVFPDHFVEDCYTFSLADCLDEYVEDSSPGGKPTQEAVEEAVALLEAEISKLRARMAVRIAA
jgi:hypothetical protein